MSAAEEFVARMMVFAPGDWIVCRGERVPIIEVRQYLPGHHDGSPIYVHLLATELVTARGSRWFGQPYIPQS